MANTIKHKRGSGSDPSASDLVSGELAIRTDTGVVFTKKDDGTVAQIAGGGDTDLGVSTTSTAVTVTSSTGDNATISEASSSAAGVMSAAHHDKLDGIESNATADQTASEILTAIKTVDGSGTGLDADLLDGVHASSFLRSDANDTMTGNLLVNARLDVGDGTDGNTEIRIYKSNNNVSDHIQFYNATTRVGEIGVEDTNWLRINQETNTNIYTPRYIRADNGFFVDGTSKGINGSGNFIGGTIAGASDYGTLIRSNANDNVTGHTEWQDNYEVRLGNGADLKLYHDGTNSYIDGGTGDTYIRGNGDDLYLRAADDVFIQTQGGETAAKFIGNGAAQLHYNNSQKFATKSDGVDITGELQCDSLDVDGVADITGNVTLHANLDLQDNDQIRLGTGDDLKLYHDGTDGLIVNDTNALVLKNNANDASIYLQTDNGSGGTTNYIRCNGSTGDVILYQYGSQKLQTFSSGVDITGELQCDSLDVDGGANITGNVDINGNIRHNGDTNTYFGFSSNDNFRIVTAGAERFRITSTGAIAIEGSSNYGSSGQVLTSNGNDAPSWQDGGGTVASGCIYENSQTISANYSITSGKNAMSAGPITIASGVTVTVTSGSTYTIV